MSLSDPLADMLTRIRNGQKANMVCVNVLYSKMHESVLEVMQREGYIKHFKVEELRKGIKQIKVFIRYYRNQGVIKSLNRVSRPGLRIYFSVAKMKVQKFYNGLGLYIISTSKGIVSDKEARKLNVGGEVLCNIY